MDRLRSLFEALGLQGVETLIASGNVVFDAAGGTSAGELERRIERHLAAALGYEVDTFLRTLPELVEVAGRVCFPDVVEIPAGTTLFVAFLRRTPPDEAGAALLELSSPVDSFAVAGREVYWLRRGTSRDSPFSGAVLEKVLGGPATLRNITTVRKLVARFGESAA
jgi:uncharacterized protein (DUF1697 family)